MADEVTTIPIACGAAIEVEPRSDDARAYLERLPRPTRAFASTGEIVGRLTLTTDRSIELDPTRSIAHRATWSPAATDRVAVTFNGATGWMEWRTSAAGFASASFSVHPHALRPAATLILRQLAANVLPARGAILVHASAVAIDGRAALFLGASTAGKTTTARRAAWWGATRIADDMVVVYPRDGHRAHPFVTDRAASLAGRLDGRFEVRRAFAIAKGATVSRVGSALAEPLREWCRAVLSIPVTDAQRRATLEAVASLAATVPLARYEVCASGDVAKPIERLLLADR